MKTTDPPRRYDLDWLRVIAFAILILFHCGMMFNTWDWHIKNNYTTNAIESFMNFLHQWRMPLLFFISGAAVWFAMEKYSLKQYFAERHKRLLIPLLFGMLVVIPPQVYHERLFQGHTLSFTEFYTTVLQFKPYPEGNFSWHHMWYIPYIFTFSLITIPLFRYWKSENGRNQLARFVSKFENGSLILLWFIPMAISENILRPFWQENRNNLISDWAQFSATLILFCLGYILASQRNIWQTIERLRFKSLSFGCISFIILFVIWESNYEPNKIEYAVYRVLRSLNIWCWILILLGFGRRHLNFNNSVLKYTNEAVYPFYIVHQTVTVVAGYYLISWDIPILPKFLVVTGLTIGFSWIIYEIVKRNNLTRLVFGLKMRTSNQAERTIATEKTVVSYGAK
ncbi:acyltransferase family protein [bacterium]|nr:acyltransferase family protein [bacterium]